MDTLIAELRVAGRALRRAPLVASVAILTLAVGIGANTAIFSVVRGVLLMPLPYDEPDAIVRVWPERPFSKETAMAFREQARAFAAFSIFGRQSVSIRAEEGLEALSGLAVLGDHFTVLGASPIRGRGLSVEDEKPGAPPVAVISHALWQGRFGGAEDIVGRTVEIEGRATEVVGVLAETFAPLVPGTAVWRPLEVDRGDLDDFRDMMAYAALARLAPSADLGSARTEVRQIAARLRDQLPDYHREEAVRSASVTRLKERIVGPVRGPLVILFSAAGLVLLIACVNVATLLFARGARRRGEMATRAALGATRGRLMRQLLAEHALLALAGGFAGATVAWWLSTALVAMLPASLPRTENVHVTALELGFALSMALVAVVLAGLPPAMRAASDFDSGRGAASRGRPTGRPTGRFLIAVEVGLAVVLVVGSGLMIKSLWRLAHTDPGFVADGVVTLPIRLPALPAGDEARRVQVQEALAAAREVPGVAAAALIDILPMTGGNRGLAFSTPDHVVPADEPPLTAGYRILSPDYFDALGVPLLDGRLLDAGDRADSAPVGVVNQALVRRLWADENAVGKELRWPDGRPWLRIVGVVGDVRQSSLDQSPGPTVYQSFEQATGLDQLAVTARLIVRADRTVRSSSLGEPVARALRAAMPDATLSAPMRLDDIVGASTDRSRFLTGLLTAFGALAVLLATIGLYGVGAEAVAERTHEIGVRTALGARRGAVVRAVLAAEVRAVAIGVAVGVLVALAAARLLEAQLYEVAPLDLGVVFVAVAIIALAAGLAVWSPARRAASLDPVVALRDER